MYTGGVHRIYRSSGTYPVLQLYAGSYRLTLQEDHSGFPSSPGRARADVIQGPTNTPCLLTL